MNNTHAISHLFSLHGKTALVTGCKRGIGRAMAVGLAEAGADIIGVSATLEPTGSAVEKEVTALGRSFTSYACDFSDRSALKEFIDKVQKSHPVIDILINNAGTILRKPAAEHPDEYWDAIIETNLSAQFLLARELGQKMIERGCGKWRDFLGLGISGAVLFHTHLFSAMALTFAALAASPAILCKSGAWLKATIAGGVAMALVVPWLIFSGFFDTASTVPKVYRLFESADDILAYMLDRPLPLVLVGGLVMALLIARLFPKSLPGGLAPILQSHAGIYIVLICWMASAYLAFHTIIPAASFFYERLSLVLWTPFVLVVAVLISDLLRKGAASWTPVLAVGIACAFLIARGRFAPMENTSIAVRRPAIVGMIDALKDQPFTPDTRFYATPNEHLTAAYYTGLPVQSVAPVRRAFLENYPGTIIYLETQMDALYPTREDIDSVLHNEGWLPDEDLRWYVEAEVWNALARDDLRRREIPVAPEAEMAPEILRLVGEMRAKYPDYLNEYMKGVRASPVLRGIPARMVKDVWMGFFLRFVDPGSRIGQNLNILSRLQKASIQYVPEARLVIYTSPGCKPVQDQN